jgi:hypothetical protein
MLVFGLGHLNSENKKLKWDSKKEMKTKIKRKGEWRNSYAPGPNPFNPAHRNPPSAIRS